MNTTQPTTSPIVDEGTVRQALDGIGTLAYLKQTDNDVIMIIYDFPRCGMVRFVKLSLNNTKMKTLKNQYLLTPEQVETFATQYEETTNAELAKQYDLTYFQAMYLGKSLGLKKGKVRRAARKKTDPTPKNLKRCSYCKEVKPMAAYHNCSATPDGKQRRCKACNRGKEEEVKVVGRGVFNAILHKPSQRPY